VTDREILAAVEAAKQNFGTKCGKYTGAFTVEMIRHALEANGVSVSPRDVFILGIPIEIDILIPRRGATPLHSLLYTPADVLAIVEIKNRGSFGSATIQKVRANFAAIREANPQIQCCYLTLAERKTYKWTVTDENCGGDVYTMFWHRMSHKQTVYDSTGDWERFVSAVKEVQ